MDEPDPPYDWWSGLRDDDSDLDSEDNDTPLIWYASCDICGRTIRDDDQGQQIPDIGIVCEECTKRLLERSKKIQ